MKIKSLAIASTFFIALLANSTGVAQRIPVRSSPREAENRAPVLVENGVASRTSPAVDLLTVGRIVAPGVIEVSPEAIRGRRLVIPAGPAAWVICIGRHGADGTCSGIYINTSKNAS